MQPINPFKEGIARTMEARVEADRIRHTRENAIDLFKNSGDVFGAGDSDKGSEVALRVLSRYERATPYRSFKDIEVACDNPNGNKKVAEADRRSVAESVFAAMNGSVSSVDGLVTDLMTPEMIDEVLPPELKGVGEFVKEIVLTEAEESSLVEINKKIEEGNLYSNKANDRERGKYFSDLGRRKDAPGSITEIYVEMQRSMLENIGVEPDVPETNKELVRSVRKIERKIAGIDLRTMEDNDVIEAVSKRAKFYRPEQQERVIDKEYDEAVGEEIDRDYSKEQASLLRESYNPNSPLEHQMAWVEIRLNHIENYSTRDIKSELALGHYYTYPLFDILAEGKAPPEIITMIETRLTMKAIGDAVAKNSGSMGGREAFLGVLNTLEDQGFDLSQEVIISFFENMIGFGVGGGKYGKLRTAEAWNLMEMANFGYETMLHWAEFDGSPEIKRLIAEYNEMGERLSKGREIIEKDGTIKREDFSFTKMTGIVDQSWNKSLNDTDYRGIKRNYFLDTIGRVGKVVEFSSDEDGEKIMRIRKARTEILKKYMIERISREIALDYKLSMATGEERITILSERKRIADEENRILSTDGPGSERLKRFYLEHKSHAKAMEGLSTKEMEEIGLMAAKSMQMSEFMFWASGENSVVNWDFISGDEVAEVFNIQLLRILDGPRNKKGKAAGPQVSLLGVKSLSPGFVRQFSKCYDADQPIYVREKGKRPAVLDDIKKLGMIYETYDRGYVEVAEGNETNGDPRIDSRQRIKYDALENKGLWAAYWFSIWGKKLWPAHDELLDSTLPVKKDLLDETYYQKVIDHFNKVDGQIGSVGEVQANWFAGKLQGILYRTLSEWDENDLIMLRGLVTKHMFSTDEHGRKPFISDEDWKIIGQKVGKDKRIWNKRMLKIFEIMFVSPFSGGKKH